MDEAHAVYPVYPPALDLLQFQKDLNWYEMHRTFT